MSTRPGIGSGEPADDPEQRRLAAPRRAEQADELATFDLEVDTAQGFDGLATPAEHLVHAPDRHMEIGTRHSDTPGCVVHVHGVVHDV